MRALQVKICGMRDPQNIKEIENLSPDFIGFIFYPLSKRFVGVDFKMPLINSAIKKVGVFVNDTVKNIVETVEKHKLDFVQLHGNESPEFCNKLKKVTNVIKAFGIDKEFDFSTLTDYENCCSYFLFDTKTNEYGGSGKTFNWNLLKSYTGNKPFFISGGIAIENISQITKLKSQHPSIFAVDLNSKFELEPAIKDVHKLKRLVNELPS